MRVVLGLVVIGFLFSLTADAQDLPERPLPHYYDPTTPIILGPLVRETIDMGTPIPDGMVWTVEHKLWFAREINSCDRCGKPMTFAQAAFDRKSTTTWGAAFALGTAAAVVAARRPCVQQLTCKEFFGRPTIGKGIAFQAPVLVASWLGTAYLRKGSVRYHIGGQRRWWIVPMIYQTLSGAFMAANLARF